MGIKRFSNYIPILISYDGDYKGANSFSGRQAFVLPDPISAKATAEINGAQILTVVYPISAPNSTAIGINKLVLAKVNPYQRLQVYRIFSVRRTMHNQQVEFKAEPVSNDMRHFSIPVCQPASPVNPSQFWVELKNATRPKLSTDSSTGWLDREPFYFGWNFTNYTKFTTARMNLTQCTFLEALGGVKGSLLDTYGGGEIERDNNNINYRTRLGADRGFMIEYGVNLIDVDFSMDLSDTAFSVTCWSQFPASGNVPEQIIYGDTIYLESNSLNNYGTKGIFVEVPHEEVDAGKGLTNMARAYIKAHPELTSPKISMKVDFVNLQNKKGYEQFDALQNVQLGDDVTIKYNDFGINVKSRIVSYEYDLITGEYTKLEIGDTQRSFIKQYNAAYGTLYSQAFNTIGKTVTINP